MKEIALHLLDIAENSVCAGAITIEIRVCEDLVEDRLRASVKDDGKGMDAALVEKVIDPFTTSRTTRSVGLGIPLFKAAAEACNGWLRIDSTPGEGTLLEVEFQHSHIDRMPLGDLTGTLLTLVVSNPDIRWIFCYEVRSDRSGETRETTFDSLPIHEALGGISFSEPEVLTYIRTSLENGISTVRNKIPEPA